MMFRTTVINIGNLARTRIALLPYLRNSCCTQIRFRHKSLFVNARSTLNREVKCLILNQPSRYINKLHGKPESTTKTYLWILVIGSICVGVILFSVMGFTKVKRRMRGIEDVKENSGSMSTSKHFFRYKGVVLPKFTEKILTKLENFEVRPDDVWVVSFPRSGTTFTQEIAYLINTGVDIQKAKTITIDERFPYLEYITPGVDAIDKMESPRHIKTHLPLAILPKDITKAKVIYVARNPKDTVVSYYHFAKLLKTYDKPFEDFVDGFVNTKVGYAPWTQHVLDFWNIRDNPNVLFITYEDICEDTEGSIRKIAQFLNKPVSDKDVQYIFHHCSFDNMKKNENVNYEWMRHLGVWDNTDKNNSFLRKGKIGEWRKSFDKDTNYKINRMVAHKLKGTGLTFRYDKEDPYIQYNADIQSNGASDISKDNKVKTKGS